MPNFSEASALPSSGKIDLIGILLPVNHPLLVHVESHDGELADRGSREILRRIETRALVSMGCMVEAKLCWGAKLIRTFTLAARSDCTRTTGGSALKNSSSESNRSARRDGQFHALISPGQRGGDVPVGGTNALHRGPASSSRRDSPLRRCRIRPPDKRRLSHPLRSRERCIFARSNSGESLAAAEVTRKMMVRVSPSPASSCRGMQIS